MSHVSCQVSVLRTGLSAVTVFVEHPSALAPHHWMPHLILLGQMLSLSRETVL